MTDETEFDPDDVQDEYSDADTPDEDDEAVAPSWDDDDADEEPVADADREPDPPLHPVEDFHEVEQETFDALLMERDPNTTDADKEAFRRQQFEAAQAKEKRERELAEYTQFMREAVERQRQAIAGVTPQAEEPEGEKPYYDMEGKSEADINALARARIRDGASYLELQNAGIDILEMPDLYDPPRPDDVVLVGEYSPERMSQEDFQRVLARRERALVDGER